MIRKLLSLVFARWVLVLLGLIALALIIWYVGPLIAIAQYRPLESPQVRSILIAAVFGLYLARIVWRFARAKLANKRLIESLFKPEPRNDTAPGPGAKEVAELKGRFEEAISALKQTRLGTTHGGASWLHRLTGQYVYQLPWYIFIGAPGSGKTTALVNSGLRFPLADKFGESKIRGVGGTRNCDWWFTEDAVFLDTAGRYTTQESDQAADSSAWRGFVDLIRKYRPRSPINGVFVTVSVSDIIQENATERLRHATAIRNRVQELHTQLGIRFPIYVLVTKTDLLAGFAEFFDSFGADERGQVWGTSFAYVTEGEAASPLMTFKDEYKALEDRLNLRLIERMQQERDMQRRAAIYVFPQQFAALKDPLNDFLLEVFAPSRFEEKPLLRGVYFTSGTQEGSPIDRILGSLSRVFGLDRTAPLAATTGGKSFFLSRLLREVVFPEAHLSGTNLKWERRRALVQWGGLAALGIISVALLGLWGTSYSRNKSYVTEIDKKIEPVESQLTSIGVGTDSDVIRLLPALDAVRSIARTTINRDGTPASMTFGLYQGDKLDSAARNAYDRLLRDAFLPRLATRIEEQMREGILHDTELLYESLKAYLMINDRQHFDAEALKAYVTVDWDNNLPQEVTIETRQSLTEHLDRLLALDGVTSPVVADERLIANARSALQNALFEERVYARLKRLDLGKNYLEFTVARAAGNEAAVVFKHKSNNPITKGVPGLYSYAGYYDTFKPESERVSKDLASEQQWVLGLPNTTIDAVKELQARDDVVRKVRRLFLLDYANVWEMYVKDIQLAKDGDLTTAIRQTRVLSDKTNSPLKLLLTAIVKEVTLVKKSEAEKSILEKGEDFVTKQTTQLTTILKKAGSKGASQATTEKLEMIVDERFNNLRQYVQPVAPGAPAKIDDSLQVLDKLHAELIKAKADLDAHVRPQPGNAATEALSDADGLPEPVQSLIKTLARSSVSATAYGTVEQLNQELAPVASFCNKALSGRYPIVRTSKSDVTPDDFARVFAPGEALDGFFQKNLAPMVDLSTRPWTFKPTGNVRLGGASGGLAQFQRAATIRDVFFRGGGKIPTLNLEFTPVEMDEKVQQFILDVDGQPLRYSHGQAVPTKIQWPGTRGTSQVRLEVLPADAEGQSRKVYDGPWALYRMFDNAKITPTNQPERFFVTFAFGARTAQFEVRTSSVQNPFVLSDLQQFQCPSRF